MATYTQNYSLHQWEDSDDFLRSDFNSDFAKIDTALGAIASSATTAQASSVNNAYNIYNLMLQNYYEGKYTGYKSALLFDGFMDSEGISSLTSGFVRSQDSLNLCGTAQSSIIPTVGSDTLGLSTARYSPVVTMTGSGYISAFLIRTYNTYNSGSTVSKTVTYTIYINDSEALTGSVTASFAPSDTTVTATLSSPLPVTAGDEVYIKITSLSDSHYVLYYESGNTSYIWTQLTITGTAKSSGTMVAVGGDATWSQAYGWVRYTGGSVALSLVTSGGTYSLTSTETASATTLQGDSCTEATFYLQNSAESQGTVAPKIVATRSSTVMTVYDYGIVLL